MVKMSMQQLISGLETLVSIQGGALTAGKLGYRDQRSVMRWIQRKKIPKARIEAVKQLVIKEVYNGDY